MSKSNAKVPGRDTLPKSGRVNEVCQEWMVREDSALAYRLQHEEFDEHLTGNRFRNAVVREDFPRAKDEQLREQRMAEQAAAIYQKMLAEQEESDCKVARELALKVEREEQMKRRAVEMRDMDVARQILDKDRKNRVVMPKRAEKQASPHRPNSGNYQANLPRRALAMPLPDQDVDVVDLYSVPCTSLDEENNSAELYNEPYRATENMTDHLNRIDIAEIGVPIDARQIQEERDAQLARKLQEQEGSLEDSLLNRDRLLAIEAQDKELAKLLQERERAKAKRARERAKQKSIAKKQLQLQNDQILPDDSYSFPADLLPSSGKSHRNIVDLHEEDSYSLPVDDNNRQIEYKQININAASGSSGYPSMEGASSPAVRPTQLDLRSPLTRINKPRFPDPVINENCDSQHANIAIAIDPTYPRRAYRLSSSYDTGSSTVTTSTSSSSPGMILPPPELEFDDDSPAPPYMPIQGQRRTASLEKKKKKGKDGGCKQQ